MAPAVCPLAICCTIQPVLTVGMARIVSPPQSNHVTTFNDWISAALKRKNRKTQLVPKCLFLSYFN